MQHKLIYEGGEREKIRHVKYITTQRESCIDKRNTNAFININFDCIATYGEIFVPDVSLMLFENKKYVNRQLTLEKNQIEALGAQYLAEVLSHNKVDFHSSFCVISTFDLLHRHYLYLIWIQITLEKQEQDIWLMP